MKDGQFAFAFICCTDTAAARSFHTMSLELVQIPLFPACCSFLLSLPLKVRGGEWNTHSSAYKPGWYKRNQPKRSSPLTKEFISCFGKSQQAKKRNFARYEHSCVCICIHVQSQYKIYAKRGINLFSFPTF